MAFRSGGTRQPQGDASDWKPQRRQSQLGNRPKKTEGQTAISESHRSSSEQAGILIAAIQTSDLAGPGQSPRIVARREELLTGRLSVSSSINTRSVLLQDILQPPEKEMSERAGTTNWPELAIGLYDRLTGRQAEIAYAFDNFSVDIPSSTSAEAEHAHWKMNGTLRISTRDQSHPG